MCTIVNGPTKAQLSKQLILSEQNSQFRLLPCNVCSAIQGISAELNQKVVGTISQVGLLRLHLGF